jgi:SAM-dependent methyltransferase
MLLLTLLCFFTTTNINCSGIRKLTDKDIQEIYATFIKPNLNEEYQQRYVPLPVAKNNKTWRWEGKDFPRVIAILEFERFIQANNISCEKGLAINGLDPEWYYISAKKIISTNYDLEPKNHDLYTLNLNEHDFDFVMANQTLEHVYDPIQCLENLYKHMRPGGILYLNVPSNSILHSLPFHFFTGYTPVGVGAVVQAAGFKILSIGQWGNLEYLTKMHSTLSWPEYRELQNPGYNDLNCPVITWVFAEK